MSRRRSAYGKHERLTCVETTASAPCQSAHRSKGNKKLLTESPPPRPAIHAPVERGHAASQPTLHVANAPAHRAHRDPASAQLCRKVYGEIQVVRKCGRARGVRVGDPRRGVGEEVGGDELRQGEAALRRGAGEVDARRGSCILAARLKTCGNIPHVMSADGRQRRREVANCLCRPSRLPGGG